VVVLADGSVVVPEEFAGVLLMAPPVPDVLVLSVDALGRGLNVLLVPAVPVLVVVLVSVVVAPGVVVPLVVPVVVPVVVVVVLVVPGAGCVSLDVVCANDAPMAVTRAAAAAAIVKVFGSLDM
jgi:hypothetical protein